ncbi:mu-protocadherin-cell-suface protein, partial [bacterium]|nr:mu-protocadherin-cell-suface protein [bacterium]
QNVMTGDNKPVAGSVDKKTQRAAWRIGDNKNTVIETGLFNLTQDVTPVSMDFGKGQSQTWLMVRLPAPEMPGAPTKVDTTGKRELPPVMGKQTAATPPKA